jgi:uncharacterized protein YjbI with pentapeptide repeats
MTNGEHVAILKQGIDAWNEWRKENPAIQPDLRRADLSGMDLIEADLANSDLRGADLRNAKLNDCNLGGADLREAVLCSVDLRSVKGEIRPGSLAGADLAGCKLPDSLAGVLNNLSAASGISDNAQKLFVAMLAACLYSWLTIATTTDVNLITNRASSALPIIQTSIPIVSFYVVTPLLLLGAYFYFHFYLQKLWDELGSLPAVFPDYKPLQTKADPWLISDLVRAHVARLRTGRPFLSYFQVWVSILLAWWLVPITLVLFWGRYLPRHDLKGTVFHSVLAGIAVTAAVSLYHLAGTTLRGAERKPFIWDTAIVRGRAYKPIFLFLGSVAALLMVALAAINGVRSSNSDSDYWPKSSSPAGWVPRVMSDFGYTPFANLASADISIKPANWTGKSDSELESVTGLQMAGVDLRYADMRSAFLPKTILTDAHLEGADLFLADLRQAELAGAKLKGTDLMGAHLNGADLVGADLQGADLAGADMTGTDVKYADFRSTKRLMPEQLANVTNKEQALYDEWMLQAMSLAGNNEKVLAQQKAEREAALRDPSAAEAARVERLSRLIPGKNAEAAKLVLLITHREGTTGLQAVAVNSPATNLHGHSFSVTEIAKLYNFPENLDGQGQTIGIIELGGGYRDSDLDTYFNQAKLPRPKVLSVSVDGKVHAATGDPNGPDAQVELDIEVVGAVAPKSQIVVYFSSNTERGYLDAVNKAVSDTYHHPSVLLICWGKPESSFTSKMQVNEALSRAALSGITIIASSGDSGASDGVNDNKSHVDFPASSPWVLGVGGTTLLADKNTILSEVVWNDGNLGGATGGGVSQAFAQPEWQKVLHLPTVSDGQPGRGVPDVAANASPQTGYQLFIDGLPTVIGGTSVSAPLWAGLIALLNQGAGRNLGYINPLLYKQLGPNGVFHDITNGNNTLNKVNGFSAGPGWDLCTGWGTPDGKKLLEAIKSSLKDSNQ